MARGSGPIKTPDSGRQVRFHELLVVARATWLMDALGEALGRVDPNQLKREISKYAPPDVQQILAATGIRDEHIFPTPIILEAQPTLIGYYRLLLGIPQKTFYGSGTGMSLFRNMEAKGTIIASQKIALPDFCVAMGEALAELVRKMTPTVTPRDVAELPLLTLGSQFQGGNNNIIGQAATKGVFLAIAEAAQEWIVTQSASELELRTASGRVIAVALAGDPDVRLQEMRSDGEPINILSIEIKGGTDKSNVYNRGGEAEKSHQGAKESGYAECWTVISMNDIDVEKLKRGSPTTDQWFETSEILARIGNDWDDFSRRIKAILNR